MTEYESDRLAVGFATLAPSRSPATGTTWSNEPARADAYVNGSVRHGSRCGGLCSSPRCSSWSASRRAGVRPRRSPCRADRGGGAGRCRQLYVVGGRAQDRVLSRAQPRLERVRREPRRRRAAACGHSSKGGGPASWSPDGQSVAFQSEDDGNEDIYVANADGSGRRNLTRNEAWDFGPTWSPDGRKIAFASNRDGNRDLRHERGRERPAEPEPQCGVRLPLRLVARRTEDRFRTGQPHPGHPPARHERRWQRATAADARGANFAAWSPDGRRSCSGAATTATRRSMSRTRTRAGSVG